MTVILQLHELHVDLKTEFRCDFPPLLDAHDVAGIPCDTSLDKFDSRHTGKTETKKEQILNLLAWASLIFLSEKVT